MRNIILFLILTVLLLLGTTGTNGLAQSTTSTSLTFQWDSNTEADLGGYGFYVGDAAEGPYDLTEDNIPKSDTGTVTFTIPDVIVSINAPTFFVVDAFNTGGDRSGFSNPCQYIHCIPSDDETQVVPCPTGFTGTGITQTRKSSCTFNSMPTWGPWTEVSRSCTAQTACVPSTTTRQGSCGEGYTGSITETRTVTCPNGQYGTPVDSGWIETSRNCTALTKCVIPAPRVETLSCGEGFSGSITRTQTATCPDTYGVPVWGPVVESRNCTALPKCVVPPAETQNLSCGEGFSGSITRTRTATCPGTYGTPVWGDWVETKNCTPLPPCIVPQPETITSSCGEGYSGSITKTRTATCPGPYGAPIWGEWKEINTCIALPLCTTSTDSKTLSCPAGYTGNIIEARSSSCPDKYGTPVWSDWSQISNTCTAIPTTCTPITETKRARCEKWYYKGSTIYVRTKVCNSDGTYSWTDWTLQSSTCRPWWTK